MWERPIGEVNSMVIERVDGDAIIEQYSSDEYEECEYEVANIDPRKIIALSRVPDDRKLESLRKSVQEHGWNDPSPSTLHVYRIPTGEYIVGSGGNHRTVLSNELGLEVIEASVTVMVPVSLIPNQIMERIAQLRDNQASMWKELRTAPGENMQRRTVLLNQVADCDLEIYGVLKSVVERLGWTPPN